MNKKILLTATIFGILAIILGAFGAHALKKLLSIDQLSSFETGVKYLMYHSLFLLFLGSNNSILETSKKEIFYLTFFGTTTFSGSIFLLSTMPISNINFKSIGFLTPIGGILLITAWFLMFLKIYKSKY